MSMTFSLLLFPLVLFLLITGQPIAFILGGVGVVLTYFLWEPHALNMVAHRIFHLMSSYTVVCVGMFIFMGVLLERCGMVNDLFKVIYLWSGRLRGGLAVGTVAICMLFSAMTGVSGPTAAIMGLTTLPEMLKRNYDKQIALGCISAGAALGILIPPSVTMVIYAIIAEESVGHLFAGGIIPGLLLGFLFSIYIILRCLFQPNLAPTLPPEERATWLEKIISLKGIILPLCLIFAVMGTIFLGVATPTEASGAGAFGAIIIAAIYKKLNWALIKEACFRTARVSAMGLWIYVGALVFTTVYAATGAQQQVANLLLTIPGEWGPIIAMQIIWIVLGCFIDPWGIIMLTAPVFLPVIAELNLSFVWFGVLFIMNMQMAYITPPFGFDLFYLKGVAPPEVSLVDIYKSVWPFFFCQLLGLTLVILFPQLVLWLPGIIFG